MRDLTADEQAVLNAFGDAVSMASKLPKLHNSDIPELVHHTHACQNIILARPAYEAQKTSWENATLGNTYGN